MILVDSDVLIAHLRGTPEARDWLIAATADIRGLSLATLNVRHFPMFEGIQPPFELI